MQHFDEKLEISWQKFAPEVETGQSPPLADKNVIPPVERLG